MEHYPAKTSTFHDCKQPDPDDEIWENLQSRLKQVDKEIKILQAEQMKIWEKDNQISVEEPEIMSISLSPKRKTVILCCICEYVMLPKIGICKECHESLKLTKITDHLYLTNFENAQDYKTLTENGIKQILVVGKDMLHQTEELKTKYILIDDRCSENIMIHFEDAHDFIKQDVTVVHCYAGISRSPSIVISFLMKEHGMSLEDALQLCKQKRSIVDPNEGFMEQLSKYEEMLQLAKEDVKDLLKE